MKSNSKKHGGFTLLEIVISMAIIAIISIGVYNAYLLIIRQTKAGEVKQTAALEGKKVIEEIKSNKVSNGVLNLDGKTIELNGNNNIIRLGKDYEVCIDQNSDNYVYIQEIKLKKNELSLSNNAKIGYLYDVTVTIKDKKDNVLFSGKYNQNININ